MFRTCVSRTFRRSFFFIVCDEFALPIAPVEVVIHFHDDVHLIERETEREAVVKRPLQRRKRIDEYLPCRVVYAAVCTVVHAAFIRPGGVFAASAFHTALFLTFKRRERKRCVGDCAPVFPRALCYDALKMEELFIDERSPRFFGLQKAFGRVHRPDRIAL